MKFIPEILLAIAVCSIVVIMILGQSNKETNDDMPYEAGIDVDTEYWNAELKNFINNQTQTESDCTKYEKLDFIMYENFGEKQSYPDSIAIKRCVSLSNEEIIIKQNEEIIELLKGQKEK